MIREEKAPTLVTWIGYLAAAMLLTLPLAVLTVRSGAWQQGLLLYALACLGAALLLAILLILLLVPRYAPWRGAILGRAALAVPGTLLLFSLLANRGDHPPIHDITTDTGDPPRFTAAEAARGPEANPLEIDPQVIEQQQQAYPDLDTLVTTLSVDDAFERALSVARELGWEVYHEDRNAGVIEAVDTTPIMDFSDDIIIRVRGSARGTLLDLRSVSRVGIGDLGANADRIRTFQQAFQQ
jgi:uncharacterized protein (DUF1499 family)